MEKVKRMLPSPVDKRLRRHYQSRAEQERQQIEAQLPKTQIRSHHVEHCRIVANRSAMLEHLGQRDVIAEVGVNRGEFSQELLDVCQPTRLHLVDIWGTDRYHEGLFNEVREKFSDEIEKDQVHIHRKLSTDAASDFEDNYFDFIYIDTDHSYATTRDELQLYASKLKSNGVIAGHDYTMGNWTTSYRYGVVEAVHEFCDKFDWELCCVTADPTENQSFAIRKRA